jgi:hypothetical protein
MRHCQDVVFRLLLLRVPLSCLQALRDCVAACRVLARQAVASVAEDIFIDEISSSMPQEVAEFTKSLIRAGLRKFKIEKDVAQHVRRVAAAAAIVRILDLAALVTRKIKVAQNVSCTICFARMCVLGGGCGGSGGGVNGSGGVLRRLGPTIVARAYVPACVARS